jgi:hypothetical protein
MGGMGCFVMVLFILIPLDNNFLFFKKKKKKKKTRLRRTWARWVGLFIHSFVHNNFF